jgi:HlyD family secretion protein
MAQESLQKLRIHRDEQPALSTPPRRSRSRWRGIAASVILLAIGAIGYLGYAGWLTPGIQVEVGTVILAYPSQAFTLLNGTGYVVAQRRADVASKATGRLEWLGVEEGSRVKKGEVIARLENQDVTATMEQAAANVGVAEANVEQAQAELRDASLALERARSLIKRRSISQEAYDATVARSDKAHAAVTSAKAAVVAAQAVYRGAQVAVEYTLIRAPFDGVILAKNANIGDVVAPFSTTPLSKGAVVSMADMDTLEVEADVSESNLEKVKLDQPCEIQLDALPDSRFRGVVHRIVPTVDRTKATVLVKVRFVDKDSRILPEMSAKVAFLSQALDPAARQARLIIPKGALITRDGRSYSFLVTGNRVKLVPVTLGLTMNDLLEVAGGLKEGDRVVLNPPASLKDGARVKVKES